ncbi:MAG: VTC domain-containing protein [Chloroflexi bacterium]|nr:VTC domain-containing protein [Chloroflexota bacterium]
MPVQLYNANGSANHQPQRIERKFYLLPEKIGLAYGLLRHVCRPDGNYPSEQINSLYFDTVDLDQHENSLAGDFRKEKVRIRWYGQDHARHVTQTVYLELKSRQGFASTKRRRELQVPPESLALGRLGNGIVSRTLLRDTLAQFGYFPPEPLLPIIKISYWRYRLAEILTGQRVALDCHIRSTVVARGIGYGERELELLGGVLEVKGTGLQLPKPLSQIRILGLDWSRFSKYSSCVDAHNLEPGSVGRLSPTGRIIHL